MTNCLIIIENNFKELTVFLEIETSLEKSDLKLFNLWSSIFTRHLMKTSFDAFLES